MTDTKRSIEIIEDFEGSMIGGYEIEEESVRIRIKKEPVTRGYHHIHNYNLHFNFGIRNLSRENKKLKIKVGEKSEEQLKAPFQRIWIKQGEDEDYKLKEIDGKMDGAGCFQFDIEIQGSSVHYIANYFPIPREKLIKEIESAAASSGGVQRVIGKSCEERDIVSYEYGDVNEKPTFVFMSGYHPPEMEAISTISIMKRLANKDLRERILGRFSIVIIPLVNPDGYANNMQGSNMRGINFHWRFFGNTKEECPECHHVWEYMKKIKPVFFQDFHTFTFQNFRARPYTIPPYLYPEKWKRSVQDEINRKMSDLCNITYKFHRKFITSDRILSPMILANGLRKEFGTIISPKFHTHMKDGKENCERLVSEVFSAVIETMMEKYPKKVDPHHSNPFIKALGSALLTYHLSLKPIMDRARGNHR